MGAHEPAIAFATSTIEAPALEIRGHFGMYARRGATPAESDELASEAALRQVRIEVSGDDLPDGERELDELRGRLIEATEHWARECIEGRRVELDGA